MARIWGLCSPLKNTKEHTFCCGIQRNFVASCCLVKSYQRIHTRSSSSFQQILGAVRRTIRCMTATLFKGTGITIIVLHVPLGCVIIIIACLVTLEAEPSKVAVRPLSRCLVRPALAEVEFFLITRSLGQRFIPL